MTPMNILNLQTCLLSKDNNADALLDNTGPTSFLAEMSAMEGDLIPFVIHTGAVASLSKTWTTVPVQNVHINLPEQSTQG